VRIQLAGILKAVISMRLVRAARGGGRVPAIEVMISTGLIRDHIMNEEKTSLVREAIAAGTSQYGMQTFDQSLFHLFQSGLISLNEALRNASNADEFRMRVAGIMSSEQAIGEERDKAGDGSEEIEDEPVFFVKH
jgi:twitching motility protein PilT